MYEKSNIHDEYIGSMTRDSKYGDDGNYARMLRKQLREYHPIEVDADGNVSGGELKGLTKYHQDLRSSQRPQRNASKIKKGIENPEEHLKTLQALNFQNESLKKVYSHLFI